MLHKRKWSLQILPLAIRAVTIYQYVAILQYAVAQYTCNTCRTMYCRGQYIARIAWTRSNLININEKRSCLLPQNVNQLFFFMKTRGVNLLICVCHMTFLHLMSYFLGSSGNYTIQFKFVIIHFHIAIHQYIASILCTISNTQICHIVTALISNQFLDR